MNKVSLKGVYDMHVHSSPDIRERRYTDFQMLDAGVNAGAKGIVLKSHHGSTTDRAFLCNEYNKIIHKASNDFIMYGSITLNNAVGGLNPIAVETALKMGAKVIWLPTTHAKNQIAKNGQTGGIECLDSNMKILKPLKEIFELIKDYDVVLGTGHLSPEEIFPVVEAARNLGVRKIVVTHPEFWVVGMSHEDQVRIVKDYDVILERCFAQPMGGGVYKSNLADNLEIINKVGYKNVMVDTDGGQIENPPWEIALGEYVQYLFDNGVTQEQLDYMTKEIPSKLLGIK
ncbi:DUF6282 family protein [Fusobacterium sp. PH5-44]|uniref:DUF6282 family protein n=1 Tax=unclassified Fusobacterium TaxID=2648384 RepID=UPI003D2135C1